MLILIAIAAFLIAAVSLVVFFAAAADPEGRGGFYIGAGFLGTLGGLIAGFYCLARFLWNFFTGA